MPGTGSSKINYESFAERAKDADVWIIPSNTNYLSTFKDDNPGYTTLRQFKMEDYSA